MGKKGGGTPYIDYYISMHLGFCHGPVDELVDLTIKDKKIFEEGQSYSGPTFFDINKPKLFGGNLREGGLVGRVHYMPGRDDQVAPADLASRVSLDRFDMPAYRKIASLFFCGNDDSGMKGFKVGSNQPTVPAIYARMRRASTTLSNNVAIIPSPDGLRLNGNGANIIHECLVNESWGMGGLPSQLDLPSFQATASTLFDENFGLSLLWSGQSEIETFIQEILNHIQGLYFFNPFTGKAHLRLIRGDYDPLTIPEIGPDVADLETFRRPLWGETINEIVLSWTNPENEEEETVTYQDLANIAMQGQVVSETRGFKGIRDAELAATVCSRELRTASAPLASATIKIDRNYHKFLPGDVFRFRWPKYDIENVIFRIMEIDWGTVSDSKITLKCVEDIFGLPYAIFDPPPPTEWKPPVQEPDDPALENVQMIFRAAPLSQINPIAEQVGVELTDDLYNQIVINTYLLPTDEQFDLVTYIPHRPGVDSLGNADWLPLGEMSPQGHTTLKTGIGQDVRTRITLNEKIGHGDGPQVGYTAFFVGESEFYDEWFVFEEYHGEGEWTIRRGILDTVPHEWSTGTKVVIMSESYDGFDPSDRFADTSEIYKVQIRTSLGLSDLDLTPQIGTTRPDRPYRPYRPANVKVGVTMFGTEDQSQDVDQTDGDITDDLHIPREWEIACTWSRRNRWAEDNVYLAWDAGDVPPEPDQTTSIIVLVGDVETGRISGLTGTSHNFNIVATTETFTRLKLKFISERNGLESLQGIEIGLELYLKGYGSDWGYLWGGWPNEFALTIIEENDAVGLLPRTSGNVDTD